MSTAKKRMPYHFENNITPYIVVRNAAKAVDFYVNALGARELPGRLSMPDGRIAHTTIQIGNAPLMLADENPQWGAVAPHEGSPCPVRLSLEVDDVDAVVARAVALGAKLVFPVEDQFYGDRAGRIEDPFGHVWMISTHQEDITVEEMKRRFEAMLEKM